MNTMLVSDGLWAAIAPLIPPVPPKLRGGRPRLDDRKVLSGIIFVLKRGIVPRIARRSIESRERLGRHRWVVERTLAWLNRFRRLTIRYERRADIHQAFLSLSYSLICWQVLNR